MEIDTHFRHNVNLGIWIPALSVWNLYYNHAYTRPEIVNYFLDIPELVVISWMILVWVNMFGLAITSDRPFWWYLI